MQISIVAVGRLRARPEAGLVGDYLGRLDKIGRAHGLGPSTLREVEDKTGSGAAAEAPILLGAVPENAVLVALDERGKTPDSTEFARRLAHWRDDGTRVCAFVIGGADGLAPAIRQRADYVLSFGPMVWPHALARVMLAEQLYRAATILAGSPYHRA